MITILAPETTAEDIKVIQQRVLDLMARKEGRLITLENWGRRRLAYTVRKHRKGIYLYWRFLGHSDLVAELERLMRMIEKVIRYMTILVDADVDPSARPDAVSEEQLNEAAVTIAYDTVATPEAEREDDSDAAAEDMDDEKMDADASDNDEEE